MVPTKNKLSSGVKQNIFQLFKKNTLQSPTKSPHSFCQCHFFPISCSHNPYTRSQKQLKKKKKQKQYKKKSLSFLMYGQIQMWQLRLAVWNNRQSGRSIEWLNDNVSRAINFYTLRFFLIHYYTRYCAHFQCCTGLLEWDIHSSSRYLSGSHV